MTRFESESAGWRELLEVLDLLISGDLGATEGCRLVWNLRHELGQSGNRLFDPFAGVYSETDSFPLGEVRNHWSTEGLKRADEKRAAVERHYSPIVTRASEALRQFALERLKPQLS
jgi:hypothetical protein